MDLFLRAGDLKGMLSKFGLSPRYNQERSAVFAGSFPDGVVADEEKLSTVVDNFLLQHRLLSGKTVVAEFVAAHPELTSEEHNMLLSWQDPVDGIFEVTGRDREAVVLFGFVDELTYRTRSNMGPRALRQLKKGMIIISRLIPVGEDWMISGRLRVFPASHRDQMLTIAAEAAARYPQAIFRNPAKLAEARDILAAHRATFVDLFGTDLIVVPGHEVAQKLDAFHEHVDRRADPAGEEPRELPPLELSDDVLDDPGVAIYFAEAEGVSVYPRYSLLDDLFRDPALIARRRYRETLSEFLRDPETSPEPLRRLAERDPDKASRVFTRLLKRKGGFRWDADGEELLRRNKPHYFDGTVMPRTIPLSPLLAAAYKRAQ